MNDKNNTGKVVPGPLFAAQYQWRSRHGVQEEQQEEQPQQQPLIVIGKAVTET